VGGALSRVPVPRHPGKSKIWLSRVRCHMNGIYAWRAGFISARAEADGAYAVIRFMNPKTGLRFSAEQWDKGFLFRKDS